MMDISPLAPTSYAELPPIQGVRMKTIEAGIKYHGRDDVLLMIFDQMTPVAGVFTQSKCPSAPVDYCRQSLQKGVARALLVNSGNANAFTGQKGSEAVHTTADIAKAALGCQMDEIYLASTGVIGEPLDAGKFGTVMDKLVAEADQDHWLDAARAIMTTDTYPKLATRTAKIGDHEVVINGIAKGSGMIMPDMATMLSFIVTDAQISQPVLQQLLSQHVATSFNAISVDSDTSTSDSVLLFATGRSGPEIVDIDDPLLQEFSAQLSDLMRDLALQIVRDGEGATKQVEVLVTGAKTDEAARKIALSIANSPLVKTAVAGEDANWGRVVMAVGKAGEEADRDRLSIWFGNVRVAYEGERDPDYSEEDASKVMTEDEILIKVDLGLGSGAARMWTCDLTKQYVAINGDYRS